MTRIRVRRMAASLALAAVCACGLSPVAYADEGAGEDAGSPSNDVALEANADTLAESAADAQAVEDDSAAAVAASEEAEALEVPSNLELLDQFTIGGEEVAYDAATGALMHQDQAGAWVAFDGVVCSVDSEGTITLVLDGAQLGSIDCQTDGSVVRHVVLELAPGSESKISGTGDEQAMGVGGVLDVRGTGSLLLTAEGSSATLTVGNSLNVTDGADLTVEGLWANATDSIDVLGLLTVENATLRANREVACNEASVLAGGLVEVETEKSLFCLTTCLTHPGTLTVDGGKVVLTNSTVMGQDPNEIYGVGLYAPYGAEVLGDALLEARTTGVAVETNGAELAVDGGAVIALSEKAEAINLTKVNGESMFPTEGKLTLRSGSVFAESAAAIAIVAIDVSIEGGTLSAAGDEESGKEAIVVPGTFTIADGLEIKEPENGEIGFYMFYNTVMDGDAPASYVLIEAPDPDPDPTPDPDPDPNPDPIPDPTPNPDPTPDPQPAPNPQPLPATGDPLGAAAPLAAGAAAGAALVALCVARARQRKEF